MRHVVPALCLFVLMSAAFAYAEEPGPFSTSFCASGAASAPRPADAWRIDWNAQGRTAPALALPEVPLAVAAANLQTQATQRRPVAVEYSDAYRVRQKIHKYASIATLPLFVTETWLGQSMYNDPANAESKRGAHGAVAASIGVLFGVNSVTGVWNLVEGKKNPAGRTRRTVHGILMLAADAGFVATGLLAPGEEGEEERGCACTSPSPSNRRATHRAVALSSMGIATVSYLMMLIWRD
jgi:hypothetical protein